MDTFGDARRPGNPRSKRPPSAVIVAIPARSEEAWITRCLRSIILACDAAPAFVEIMVVVGADSCTDRTPALVERFVNTDPRVYLLTGTWGSAGATRRTIIAYGLDALAKRGVRLDDIWIATTDADTVVPPTWVNDHLTHGESGADAVAGIVELYADDDKTEVLDHVFATTYPVGVFSHGHVHGANLGVRASAYVAAGGFVDLSAGEDHALWSALDRLGATLVSSPSLTVSTSARLVGRANGGFADTIRHRLSQRASYAR